MKDLIIRIFDLTGREAALKRAKTISFIFWWYLIFAFAVTRSDNQIAEYWVKGTELLLFLLSVFSYVLTARKYKGSKDDLFADTGKLDTINSILWIVMFIYTCYFSEGSLYGMVVPYVALTILLINLIIKK